jgi:hypothetical protein
MAQRVLDPEFLVYMTFGRFAGVKASKCKSATRSRYQTERKSSAGEVKGFRQSRVADYPSWLEPSYRDPDELVAQLYIFVDRVSVAL